MVGTFILPCSLLPQHSAAIQTHVIKESSASQLWFPIRPSWHKLKQIDVWIQRGNIFSSISNICNGSCRELLLIGNFPIQHLQMLLGNNKAHTYNSQVAVWDIAILINMTQTQRSIDLVMNQKSSLHFFLMIRCHYMQKLWEEAVHFLWAWMKCFRIKRLACL